MPNTSSTVLSSLFGFTKASIFTSTRIDHTDSVYSILAGDWKIYVDTDGGAATVNLPAGIDGKPYKIVNTGTAGNDVTIVPNGAELLFGANANLQIPKLAQEYCMIIG